LGARAKHQQALIMAAARLFRRKGYHGTSTAEILALSGAPRGSLYYYFPGGKEEIGAAAVAGAAMLVSKTLKALAAKAANPSNFVDLYAGELTAWLEKSGFQDGCPIATTLLETGANSEKIAKEGAKAFDAWQAIIEEMLQSHGVEVGRAAAMATMIISTIEGTLILARTSHTVDPITTAAGELKRLLLK